MKMGSRTCGTCLRAIQRQSKPMLQARKSGPTYRLFTTTSLRSDGPGLNATASTSIPPVTPEVGEGRPAKSKTPATATLKKLAPRSTETYTAYGATELLYQECAKQATYEMPKANEDEEPAKTEDGVDLGIGGGWWHEELGLEPTFSTWSQVTMLHMYLLSARFRCFEATTSQPWQQHLLDHFFYDAENRMTINHGMHARGTRNKYLKDLFIQWRGLLAAYDEGIYKGDAVLAAAIWRNVFKANEEVDVKGLAQIVSYMRRTLKGLDGAPDEAVMGAKLEFKSPGAERSVVEVKSRLMDLPFEKAPGTDLPGGKQA